MTVMKNHEALVLGIDTGGTYTDGVLLEYYSRRVLATHKSLTTRRDFALGIGAVIDAIHIEDPSAVRMVSVSTTLATNAIAEGKGKRVALLLIGYDPELIANFKLGARFATPTYYFVRGGHDVYGREKEPLDLASLLDTVNRVKGQVDAIAISSYFSPLNPEHENRAYEAVRRVTDLPIVLGNQLSTRLGSVERATTAALNASLLAVLQQFIIAVQRAMERRHIDAPLMVVRGDGTLMSAEFAARTPVETIHSGPAASAIGARFLTRLDDALVVDVGGTTTDFALVNGGQVRVGEEGARVGGYKTAVQAADLLSIAAGGDSHITLSRDNKRLEVGPERVMPLAYLAHEYPEVAQRLHTLSRRSWVQAAPEWLEYWLLLREPDGDSLRNDQERALVALLAEGPQPVPEIVSRLGVLHIAQIGAGELLRQEIIGRAGLTPTDLLHIEGRAGLWDATAAREAWKTFARFQFKEPDELRRQVWERLAENITYAAVSFLSGKQLPPPAHPEDRDMGRWFFGNSLQPAHPHLETEIRLRPHLVGIGAPAGALLQDVAAALHSDLILPKHHEVANAIGAVAGSVMVAEEILVYPHLSLQGVDVLGYFVQTSDGRELFEEEEAALAYARALSQERALGAAIRAGADNPQVIVEDISDGLDTHRIRARAVGNPRLEKP